MATVVALGATHELGGFVLAGATIVRAGTPADATAAWRSLDDDVGLVILSPVAASWLGEVVDERPDVLTAVMP